MPEPNTVMQGDPDTDLWLDPDFAPLDTRTAGEAFARQLVNDVATEEQKKQFAPEPEPEPQPAPEPAAAEPVQKADDAPPEKQSEVYELEDGATVVIEPVPTGLKATLSLGTGSGDEVFYGKDESELLRQVLVGKLNATKKIKEQARQIKLAVPKAQTASRQRADRPHELSADEKFEIKTLMASDPEKAIDLLIAKKTGTSLDELAEGARKGREASDAVYIDGESRAFLEMRPLYESTDDNYKMILGYLAKRYLGVELTEANAEKVMTVLPSKGFFTRYTLAEAYDALAQDGLLELKQEQEPETQPEPGPQPAPEPAPTPAQPASGIRKTVRPRATAASVAYGIRGHETHGSDAVPGAGQVPSVEELESMSTEDINALMQGVMRERARSARR